MSDESELSVELPPTVEVGNNFPDRSAADVRRAVLDEIAQDDGLENLLAGDEGGVDGAQAALPEAVASDQESASLRLEKWVQVSDIALRGVKAIYCPARKYTPDDYRAAAVPCGKALIKNFPGIDPAVEEFEALIAVVTLFGSKGDEPRYLPAADESKNAVVRWLKRVFGALFVG